MAGRGADEGRRKLPGSGRGILPVRARKLRPRGQKSRDGAPRGARAPDNGARQDGRLVRRLALHPLGILSGVDSPGPLAEVEKRPAPAKAGGRRRTRRRSNNTGAHARPFGLRAMARIFFRREPGKPGARCGCLKIESGKRERAPQSSRYTRSRCSCRSCASTDSVAIGRASRRRIEIGSPVSSQKP